MKAKYSLWLAAGMSLMSLTFAADILTPRILDAGTGKTKGMLKATEMSGIKMPKDDKELAEWARKSAESGNAQGQLLLANMYDEGIGVLRDVKAAAYWYEKAADQNNTYALYILGTMYAKGEGVDADQKKAADLFGRAARQGSMRAQFNLAEMYRLGDGIDQDASQAARWYKAAADQGMPQARVIYAQMLENGMGVEKNEKEAAIQIKKVIDTDDEDFSIDKLGSYSLQPLPSGKTEMAMALLSYVDPDMPKDPEQAVKWAMDREDNPQAQILLALMYAEGCGVKQDYAQSAQWLNRAAANHVSGAQYLLGRLYYAGDDKLPQDKKKAVTFLTEAAKEGHVGAMYDLGCLYYKGDGVAQDKKQAAEWFVKSAKQQDPYAQAAIGHMLYAGDGIEQNKKDGIEWLRQAAKLGSVAALPRVSDQLPFAVRILQPDELKKKFADKDAKVLAEETLLKSLPDLSQYTYADGAYYGDGYGTGWWSEYEAVDRGKLRECEKMAKAGDVESQYELGSMYYSGKGKGRNVGVAAEWFEKAAAGGNAHAMYALGVINYFGQGNVKQDTSKALEWFKKAADSGDADAKKALGILVEQ